MPFRFQSLLISQHKRLVFRGCGRRARPQFRSRHAGGPNAGELRAAVTVSLFGIAGMTWGVGQFIEPGEDDRAWLGTRGPVSSERAIAWVPQCMCVSSGVMAAALAWRYPHLKSCLRIPGRIYSLLALPLALLLAYRFQISYERWWTSRNRIESLSSQILTLGVFLAASLPSAPEDAHLATAEKELQVQIDASKLRERILLTLEALLGFLDVVISHQRVGNEPHPANAVRSWQTGWQTLEAWPEGAKACASVEDPTVWCYGVLFDSIRRLQNLQVISGDYGSLLCQSIFMIEQHLSDCIVTVDQKSPAPLVVHLRSLVLLFCYFCPFVIIDVASPMLIVPVQIAISNAFLGVEFCSREMEYPFGVDKCDIPLRQILETAKVRLRQAKTQPSFDQVLDGERLSVRALSSGLS